MEQLLTSPCADRRSRVRSQTFVIATVSALVLAIGTGSASAAWKPQQGLHVKRFTFQGGRGEVRCEVGFVTGAPKSSPTAWFARCDGTLVGGNKKLIAEAQSGCDATAMLTGADAGITGLFATAASVGTLDCSGDAIERSPAMPNGASFAYGPFRCFSTSGVVACRSTSGHGFTWKHTTWSVS